MYTIYMHTIQMLFLSQGYQQTQNNTPNSKPLTSLLRFRFDFICERIVYAIKLLYHLNMRLRILTIYNKIQLENNYVEV